MTCLHAEKNGWSYEVQEPHLRKRQRPKRYQGYGDNFSVKRKVGEEQFADMAYVLPFSLTYPWGTNGSQWDGGGTL